MSLQGWVNFLVFQWFCVRLVRRCERYDDGTLVTLGWGLLYFVLPLSGWWGGYGSYLGRYRVLRLTGERR